MKTIPVAISLIALTLSGCAHTGYYQQDYGYSGYNGGYGSGYTVERYYDYPARGYYQPSGVMGFGSYYVPSYPAHDYHDRGHHRDRDRYNNWQRSEHRSEHRQQSNAQPDMGDRDMRRWQDNDRERQQHIDRTIERTQSRPQAPQPQMPSINHDVDRARQQIHEMRRNDFGNAERRESRAEGNRSVGEDHRRGHGFGRH